MTCGKRVKEVRKSKNMTLEKFGEVLGVKKTTISRIENGVNSLTDQMAKSISREFEVSEDWLRTGVGEMLVSISTEQKYKRVANAIANSDSDLDRIIKQTLIYYYEMDTNSKVALLNYIENIAALLPVKNKGLFSEAPEVNEMIKRFSNEDTG